MAVCNLFNDLTNTSGNFLMFSQYVEDITRNYTEGDNNYKVVPSRFVALDIDYSKLNNDILNSDNLNIDVPRYLQNYFENGCAYGRGNLNDWDPNMSKNLFWNSLWDARFLTSTKKDDLEIINEIQYYGDINMHSYNEHKGMGYGEIYCYIPTNVGKINCQVIKSSNKESITNPNDTLEGFNTPNNYSRDYYYNEDHIMSFDSDNIGDIHFGFTDKYNINTIVILYDIFEKLNDKWETQYKNIPMGIYFSGNFKDNKLTNPITKFVSSSYGNGTSYGLRICTRFSVAPNGTILNTSDISTDENYVNYCQLMVGMNENLSKIMDVVKSVHNTNQQYKDMLSLIKNNRTNVPYVKNINGDDYWFVNGRLISKVGADSSCYIPYTSEELEDHINGIPIEECECMKISGEELEEYLKIKS